MHFVYQIYCTYALYIFGPGYFGPVAMNTLLTAIIAAFGCKVAELEFGLTGQWRTVTFFAILFDPFVFVWSSLINGKDVLVLLGHVMMLYGVTLLYRGRLLRAVGCIGPAAVLMLFLRFYVPLLFVAAFTMSVLLGAGRRWFGRLLLLAGAGLAGLVAAVGPALFLSALAKVRGAFVNPAYGVPRFLLTPIPFNTDITYRFLEIPAILNWLFMPLLIWGVVLVARLRTPFSKFFLIYCAVFISLYSTYGDLQGPRHRLQLEFAIVIFVVLALRALAHAALKQGRSMPPSSDGRALGVHGGG
jgi:hypothetical protein